MSKLSIPSSFLTGGLLGASFIEIGEALGIYTGMRGVKYYSEAHKRVLNKVIHCLCMPLTFYGMSHWVPGILQYIVKKIYPKYDFDHKKFNLAVIGFYVGHYLRIKPSSALIFFLLYGNITIDTIDKKRSVVNGLTISTCSLIVQEILGHWLSGDIPSRAEGVVNSILYAPFYACTLSRYLE